MDSSVDIASKSWERMKYGQKRQMLKYLGHSTTFAKTKTISELVSRGGGFVADDFHKIVKLWQNKNPNTTIKWI